MQNAFREAQQKLAEAASQMMYELCGSLLKGGLDDPVIRLMIDSLGGNEHPSSGTALDPYRVLGLEKSAGDDEVKKRYREFLKKLHPDTAGIKGTEFLVQVVNAAYAQISKERGWRL